MTKRHWNTKLYFTINLKVCGKLIEFRIDTGADISIINENTMKQLQVPVKKTNAKRLVDAGGRELTYLGIIETEIESNHKVANTKFYVVKQAPHNLLGIPEIMALGLLERVRGLRVEERHQELYRGLGQLTEKFKIKLKKGAEPFSLYVPRRLPIGLREASMAVRISSYNTKPSERSEGNL